MAPSTDAEISAEARMGPVHLTVADLQTSLAYYEREVGLRALERDGDRASLGTGRTQLLVLSEEPGARR